MEFEFSTMRTFANRRESARLSDNVSLVSSHIFQKWQWENMIPTIPTIPTSNMKTWQRTPFLVPWSMGQLQRGTGMQLYYDVGRTNLCLTHSLTQYFQQISQRPQKYETKQTASQHQSAYICRIRWILKSNVVCTDDGRRSRTIHNTHRLFWTQPNNTTERTNERETSWCIWNTHRMPDQNIPQAIRWLTTARSLPHSVVVRVFHARSLCRNRFRLVGEIKNKS